MKNSTAENGSKTDFRTRFNSALRLRNAERYDDALRILEGLQRERPDSAPVLGILGDVFWRKHDLPNAVACFKSATKLSPKSELASLGLFHTLREQGRKRAASTEMRRFLAIAESEEYAALRNESIRSKSTRARAKKNPA